jgi:F0F1-type ATP synthase membrane subunit a
MHLWQNNNNKNKNQTNNIIEIILNHFCGHVRKWSVAVPLSVFFFNFILVILFIYTSNIIPLPGFPSENPLSHPTSLLIL